MKRYVIVLAVIAYMLDLAFPTQAQVNQAVIPIAIPIVLAALSVATSAYGSVKSSQAAKKNQSMLDGLQEENTGDFLKEYHRGSLENNSSKAYLKRLEGVMEDNRKASENTAAATGATHENVLAEKQSNNRIMSDAISGLVEREDNRQQQMRQGYITRKQGLMGTQMGINQQKAQTWAELASGVSSAAGTLAGTYLASDGKLVTTT